MEKVILAVCRYNISGNKKVDKSVIKKSDLTSLNCDVIAKGTYEA